MSILSTEKLSHSYDSRVLFENLQFSLDKGERVALVGANGVGKSTLLKILAGKEYPLEGKVVTEKDLKLGYLDQNPDFHDFNTINDFIFDSGNELQNLIRQYENLVQQPEFDPEEFALLNDKITAADAWEYEVRIKTVLDRFGIKDLEQEIHTLSGGQLKRLTLAQLLIQDPDVFLLDEPTNHLDIETIEWLERYLTSASKTVVLVTHDRYFLDNVSTTIKELFEGELYSYKGNYGYFLEKKAERAVVDQAQYEKNAAYLKRELEWMRRQPKARGTKSKARVDQFNEVKNNHSSHSKQSDLHLSIKNSRQGKKILEIHNISKRFKSKVVINGFSYIFKKGDRVGLAGKNGTGKSTFLNLITQGISPDSGSIETGETTVFGYYRQSGLPLNPGQRVIDTVKNIAEYIPLESGETITASQLLSRFQFSAEKQYTFTEKLSGGEKKRLQLLHVLIKNPNFLILDEPSNDLDIDTLNILEDFLESYAGILVIVSHDRYLLDKLTNQLFVFTHENPTPLVFNGNYSDYKIFEEIQQKEDKAREAASKNVDSKKNTQIKRKGLSFKEQKELEEIEIEITELEKSIKQQTENLSQTSNHIELQEVAQQVERTQATLDERLGRWFELNEKI